MTHQLKVDRHEVVRIGLAWVTGRQRTLSDCLGRLPEQEAEHLLAWAVTREAFSRTELERALRERPHWWGNRGRRRALADSAVGALSAAERRLHTVLRGAGIVGWVADQRIRDEHARLIARADVLFRPERLVIEVDGFAYHGRGRFQQDRT